MSTKTQTINKPKSKTAQHQPVVETPTTKTGKDSTAGVLILGGLVAGLGMWLASSSETSAELPEDLTKIVPDPTPSVVSIDLQDTLTHTIQPGYEKHYRVDWSSYRTMPAYARDLFSIDITNLNGRSDPLVFGIVTGGLYLDFGNAAKFTYAGVVDSWADIWEAIYNRVTKSWGWPLSQRDAAAYATHCIEYLRVHLPAEHKALLRDTN